MSRLGCAAGGRRSRGLCPARLGSGLLPLLPETAPPAQGGRGGGDVPAAAHGAPLPSPLAGPPAPRSRSNVGPGLLQLQDSLSAEFLPMLGTVRCLSLVGG